MAHFFKNSVKSRGTNILLLNDMIVSLVYFCNTVTVENLLCNVWLSHFAMWRILWWWLNMFFMPHIVMPCSCIKSSFRLITNWSGSVFFCFFFCLFVCFFYNKSAWALFRVSFHRALAAASAKSLIKTKPKSTPLKMY